ncbi:MAG TPA: ATP-binding cassette domain-containing protein [Rhodopila sp.]
MIQLSAEHIWGVRDAMSRDHLVIDNLVVQRAGRQVLHGVSLTLSRGEIAGLLGANGAGKSTLVMTIAGALPAEAGEVKLGDASLLGLSPDAVRRHGVSVVAEGHRILGALSVIDNLRAAGSNLTLAELNREIDSSLALFPELTERRKILAHNLSGGQKQMVAIAQALIGRPDFLMVDELSFGLAPAIVRRLGETLRQIAQRGAGVLLIEQFTTLALALSSRAHVMERGKLVFSGTPDELLHRPEILHSAYLAGGTTATLSKQELREDVKHAGANG